MPEQTQPIRAAQAQAPGSTSRGRVVTGEGTLSDGDARKGLPAYTTPPAAGARTSATPFGVGGSVASGSPFGATSTTRQAPTEEDPNATMAVPQQRNVAGGTVYGTGGYEVIDMTVPVSTNPAVENSGSLTGHILAQGWHDEVVDRRKSNVKVAIAMLVVLGLLVTVSLVFLLTAGSAFTDMISGMFS